MLLLLALLLSLSGCGRIWAEAQPLRELLIIETVGCDTADEGAALSIRAAKPDLKLRQEAPSLRLAMDRLSEQAGSGALFFAHTQFLLAGRALAEDDLAPMLDLVARSKDMRIATPLFLLENGAAADAVLLDNDDERSVTEMLNALQADGAQRGAEHVFSCAEILLALAERGAALAAACRLEDDCLRASGYGILKDGRCVGWISLPESRAADLLLGVGSYGDVSLGKETLTITGSRAAVTPVWDGAALTGAEIRLQLRAELTETDGRGNPTSEAERARLAQLLAAEAQKRTAALLRRAQTLEADFPDLGGMLAAADSARWESIKDEWSAIFPTLPITVSVTAELDRTHDLREPVPVSGGAK